MSTVLVAELPLYAETNLYSNPNVLLQLADTVFSPTLALCAVPQPPVPPQRCHIPHSAHRSGLRVPHLQCIPASFQ